MGKKWNYKGFSCKLEEVNEGVYRLYVDGEDIIGNPFSIEKNEAVNRIERYVDTEKLRESLDILLSNNKHFEKTNRGWMIDEELAGNYDGTARNQNGRKYAYRADEGEIKEAMFATAPYKGGTDMWLKGNYFDSIDEFKEYIRKSYGIKI